MGLIKIVELLLQIMGAVYIVNLIGKTILGWVANEERKDMRREGDYSGDVYYKVGPQARFFKAFWIVLSMGLVLLLNHYGNN